MAQPDNVIVYWPISCFDRRKANPLPLETKFYVLDEGRTTNAEKAAILDLIHRGSASPAPRSAPADEQVVTISHGPHGTSREILRYRPLFRECGSGEFRELLKGLEQRRRPGSIEAVSLMGEYFEDETGGEITEVDICDHAAGGAPTIIVGEPRSVTRLGPAEPKDHDSWTVETANTMAHFFQVVDHIRASSWMRSPLSMTLVGSRGIVAAAFPSVEAALGTLVLFRQLYSSYPRDNLLNRTCGAYLRHVDHPGKAWWVKTERSSFNALLDRRPPMPLANVDCSARDVLEVFLYGARLVHSDPRDPSSTQRLRDVLNKTPREQLVMAFHSGMRFLFNHALTIYPVVKQDFFFWISDVGLPKPDLIDITRLLSGRQPA